MSRIEENADMIKSLETMSGNYTFEKSLIIMLSIIVREIADISKSLAVLADKESDNDR